MRRAGLRLMLVPALVLSVLFSSLSLPAGVAASGLSDTTLHNAHYEVLIRAWIPTFFVVDPVPYADPPFTGIISTSTASKLGISTCNASSGTIITDFLGDDHNGFSPAAYRVEQLISFDWNGRTISNFFSSAAVGTTHRDISVFDQNGNFIGSCLQQATATPNTTAYHLWGSAFYAHIAASNPLVLGAPSVQASVTGNIGPDGALHVQYQTTEYPSIGIQVTRNGQVLDTNIVNDVSCLTDVEGLQGIAVLGVGLTSDINVGSYTVPADSSGRTESNQSLLCFQLVPRVTSAN